MRSVLVVREPDEFSRILIEAGLAVTNCPTIETVESENARGLGAKILAKNYDGIFLTSRRATAVAARELFGGENVYRGKIYVLGKSSYDLLKDRNVEPVFYENAGSARELLAALAPAELNDKRLLFIRGDKSLGHIREFLENRAAIDEEIVYETRRLEVDEVLKAGMIANGPEDFLCACFFSPSAADSFLEQFGSDFLRAVPLTAIGKTTAGFFAERNLKTDFIAGQATARAYAAGLLKYLAARD